ncbi:MAG: hypothetical protein IJV07_01215 [Alphaproteobacteria bacterium]|nr:hypothetical protein [Alphaproteobacteria bacterium]
MDFTWKDLIKIVLSFLLGSGITFHFTKQYYLGKVNKITQKNGALSKNNTQIGEINVRK